jgi:molecular chaperone DnaJ
MFQRGFLSMAQTCPRCQGAGRVNASPCTECGGQGQVERSATLKVTVPAGVDNGMRLRLAGEGEGGRQGGPAGSLFVVMSVEPHELFEREGSHLHLELPISVFHAMLGAEIPITTILGEDKTVVVSAGTQPWDVVRVRGGGMPEVDRGRRGDLFVHLKVVVPSRLNSDQRDVVESAAKAVGDIIDTERHEGLFDKLKRALGGE